MNKERQKLDSWSVLIKKIIRVKAKAKIQASISHNTNQYYHQSNQLIYTIATKANSQPQMIKDPWLEKLKI